jgi:RNA polymerase sigma factor (sigma-70 family)
MSDFSDDLMALRTGELNFSRFVFLHSVRFRRWAKYFFQRWPSVGIDVDDLAQEGLIEAWQAVDRWDPERGVSIRKFVEYRIGERMSREMQRVNGWVRNDRAHNKPPIFQDLESVTTKQTPRERGEFSIRLVELAGQEIKNIENRIDRSNFLETTEFDGLSKYAIFGTSLGIDSRIIGLYLFNNPETRKEFGFTDRNQATREVRKKIKSGVRKIFNSKDNPSG